MTIKQTIMTLMNDNELAAYHMAESDRHLRQAKAERLIAIKHVAKAQLELKKIMHQIESLEHKAKGSKC